MWGQKGGPYDEQMWGQKGGKYEQQMYGQKGGKQSNGGNKGGWGGEDSGWSGGGGDDWQPGWDASGWGGDSGGDWSGKGGQGQMQQGQVLTKTQICRNWANVGSCVKGTECGFAHGEHELGTPRGSAGAGGQPGAQRMGKATGKGGGKGVDNRKRKTKLCVYYASGHCPNTGHCSFAHSEEEIGEPLSELAVRLQNQATSGGQKMKTKVCMQWSMNGGCPKGANCTFAHGEEELGTPQKTEGGGGKGGMKGQMAMMMQMMGGDDGWGGGGDGWNGGGGKGGGGGGGGGDAVGGNTGIQICSVHGKKRGLSNLMDDGMGGFRCTPGFLCK